MKHFFAFLTLLIMIGCTSVEKKKPEELKMTGVYKMLSQTVKDDATDTTYTNLQQLKIFTDDFLMYANFNEVDSVGSFGVGNYNTDKDTVTENIFFTASGSSKNDTARTYELTIEKTDNGYNQIIPAILFGTRQMRLTEKYTAVGTGFTNQLDGIWKLNKRYDVKGKDSTLMNLTQYKTYYSGYCIWGSSSADKDGKDHTEMGFGKFVLDSNKVKESMMSSTVAAVRGHDFVIDVEFNGTDAFKQTIKNDDGTKSVEEYVRMKK